MRGSISETKNSRIAWEILHDLKINDNLFQICLRDIISLSLVDKGGYLTVVMKMEAGNSFVMRRSENLRAWYNTVQGMVKESKRQEMKSTEEFWTKKTSTQPENTEDWPGVTRARLCLPPSYADRQSAGSLDRGRRRDQGQRQ